MIKSEPEYRRSVENLIDQRKRLEQQAQRLKQEGLSDEQVKAAMQPLWAFHQQLATEADHYERIKRGEFDVLRNLQGIGELLIALRIHVGLSQADLAERLGVDPSVVCRDERNEYHGITIDRAARILAAMGAQLRTTVEIPNSVAAAWPVVEGQSLAT